MIRARRWLAAALVIGGVGSVAIGTPAQAASPGQAIDLGDLQATSMVQADGKLFIGAGNEILVRGLHGENLGSITREFGVADLLLSPDGTTLYAADFAGSAISVIDPASATETAHWLLGSCPSHLALLGGRLFVSYGCTRDAQLNSIGSVDASTGGTLVDSGAGHDFYNPPFLANANGSLLARFSGLSSMTTYRYAAAGASLTLLNSMDVGGARIVLSPDGTRMAIPTNSEGIIEYDSSTFAELGSYAPGNPGPWFNAVRYSPTTGRLAGAEFDNGQINVYDTTSRAQVVASRPLPADHAYAAPVLDGTMTFGPDGQGNPEGIVYALGRSPDSHTYLLAASAIAETVPHLTLTVTSPKAYGSPLSVTVNFPGHPNTTVTLKMLPNSGSPIYVPVQTNQWGVATAAIKANFSGRIYGYYGGDLFHRHEDPNASAIHTFTVPSRTTASMLGAYRSSAGVLYFHAPSNLKLHAVVGPPHVRPVTVTLQYFSGGKWISYSPASFTTNQWGIKDLYLYRGIPGLLYRTVVSTPSTVFNTGSSTVAASFKFG